MGMKWLFVVTVALMTVMQVRAEGPDDQNHVLVYNLIQEGDTLNNTGEPRRALGKYL